MIFEHLNNNLISAAGKFVERVNVTSIISFYSSIFTTMCEQLVVLMRIILISNFFLAYGEFLSGRPGEGSTVAQLVLTQLYEIQKWFHNQRVVSAFHNCNQNFFTFFCQIKLV